MSQILQKFVKFQKCQLENLVDFEKCCKTRIFLQKSEPIQPKTSNILPKFCQPTLSDVSASVMPEAKLVVPQRPAVPGRPVGVDGVLVLGRAAELELDLGCNLAFLNQSRRGSFSAVSKQNFARKYAFESSRRDLHNALLCTALKSHFFLKITRRFKFAKICKIFRNVAKSFAEFCKKLQILAQF